MLAEKYGHAIRSLHEIEKYGIVIILLNSHSAFEHGIPLSPKILEIAELIYSGQNRLMAKMAKS